MLHLIIKHAFVLASDFFRSFQHCLGHSKINRLTLGSGLWDTGCKLLFIASQHFIAHQNRTMTLKFEFIRIFASYLLVYDILHGTFKSCKCEIIKGEAIAWWLAEHRWISKQATGLHGSLPNYPNSKAEQFLFKFCLNKRFLKEVIVWKRYSYF